MCGGRNADGRPFLSRCCRSAVDTRNKPRRARATAPYPEPVQGYRRRIPLGLAGRQLTVKSVSRPLQFFIREWPVNAIPVSLPCSLRSRLYSKSSRKARAPRPVRHRCDRRSARAVPKLHQSLPLSAARDGGPGGPTPPGPRWPAYRVGARENRPSGIPPPPRGPDPDRPRFLAPCQLRRPLCFQCPLRNLPGSSFNSFVTL